MSAPCLKTLVRLVLGYALCTVLPVKIVNSQHIDIQRDYKLVFVQAAWRHGNRTQDIPYPLGIQAANALAAPYGVGNLTPNGRREAYRMGLFLRQRYGDFLPPYFAYNSINLECTAPTRTQETCFAAMASLFPPAGPQVWQDEGLGQVWTPIPCSYTTLLEDQVYSQYWNCPRMTELQLAFTATPIFRAEMARLTGLGFLNKYVALNDGQIAVNDFGLAWYYDLYATLEGMGEPIPDWVKPVFPDPLRSIYGMYASSFVGTPELARLMTGEFWRATMQLGDSLERGTELPSNRVFNGYSLHDVNLSSYIASLRPRNIARPVPPYSAVFMIEWYRSRRNSSQLAVKFLYRNDTVNDIVTPLDIPSCGGEVCSLDNFRELVSDILPSQNRSEYCTGQTVLAPAELENYRQLISLFM